MYYQVSQEFFEKLPNACFGAVAVRGLDNTHDIPQLEQMLEQGGTIGRKLDFLIQEFNREANTIGSKAVDSQIAYMVVDIKAEIEKIREQIQNIE